MKGWFRQLFEMDADRPVQVVGPRPQVIGPSPSAVVAPPARFAWDEKRWRHRTTADRVEVTGRFRVFERQGRKWREFEGRLVQEQGAIACYIADPPVELRHHRHGACLQLVNSPWFRLHWRRAPANLDDALLYMERMLDEAFN